MADENDPPPISKLTRTKQRWAREGRFVTGKTSRPDEQRLPPGQHLTSDWPTLDLGLTPQISRERWRLDVYGAVENPIFWDFAQFSAQPQTKFTSDIHCVTTWSRYDNQWEGLATRDLVMACQPRKAAALGPSPVAIHDDADVGRYGRRPRRGRRLRGRR